MRALRYKKIKIIAQDHMQISTRSMIWNSAVQQESLSFKHYAI